MNPFTLLSFELVDAEYAYGMLPSRILDAKPNVETVSTRRDESIRPEHKTEMDVNVLLAQKNLLVPSFFLEKLFLQRK